VSLSNTSEMSSISQWPLGVQISWWEGAFASRWMGQVWSGSQQSSKILTDLPSTMDQHTLSKRIVLQFWIPFHKAKFCALHCDRKNEVLGKYFALRRFAHNECVVLGISLHWHDQCGESKPSSPLGFLSAPNFLETYGVPRAIFPVEVPHNSSYLFANGFRKDANTHLEGLYWCQWCFNQNFSSRMR